MATIDAGALTTEALEGYDRMMIEATIKVHSFAGLAVAVWSDVLRELDKRGRVTLVSGSYEDVGNALITRNYE